MNRGLTRITRPLARKGFTIVELLVVITIIVVLLALLTPALDKAIYQAELAVCATNLRSVAIGAVTYAAGYSRNYPYRPGVKDDVTWPVALIYNGGSAVTAFYNVAGGGETSSNNTQVYDDRPVLRTFLNMNHALNDPLTGALDYEGADFDTTIQSAVSFWFGYQFKGYRRMKRLGDRWTAPDQSGVIHRYNVLASDRDTLQTSSVQSSHPDRKDGVMANIVAQNGDWAFPGFKFVISIWYVAGKTRGTVDLNYAFDDGSVSRYDRIEHLDPKMSYVTESNQGPNSWWATMPPSVRMGTAPPRATPSLWE